MLLLVVFVFLVGVWLGAVGVPIGSFFGAGRFVERL